MAQEFRHNREDRQYEAWVDGELVGELTYLLAGDTATFDHTHIAESQRGSGLASRLVAYAFDQVRADGQWSIEPTCSYVVAWTARHPESADLLA